MMARVHVLEDGPRGADFNPAQVAQLDDDRVGHPQADVALVALLNGHALEGQYGYRVPAPPRADLPDFRDEAVAELRDGFDKPAPALAVAEGLPEGRDVAVQAAFFDEAVGPNLSHESLLLQRPPAVAHEHQENVEDLRRQRDGQVLSQQQALRGVEAEGAEFIEMA
jgi:hypothetical protein